MENEYKNINQKATTKGNNSPAIQTDTYIENQTIVNNNAPKAFNIPDLFNRGFVITTGSNADISVSKAFQSREIEIETLKNHINENTKTVLVSGMGGIGKSEICKKLYNDYIDLFKRNQPIEIEHIGFMKYETSMDSTLVSSLGFQTDNYEQSVELAWDKIKLLANNKRVLLFVDNVNKTPFQDESLKKLFSLTCSVIVTSRNKELGNFTPYPIDKMDYNLCRELFLSFYGNIKEDEESALEDIILNLAARHTLTVELFAKIAKSNFWSIADLKTNLDAGHFNLSFIEDGEENKLIEQYQELFALSNLSEEEINILEAFSIFPYRMLPISLCNEWMKDDVKKEDINILISKINDKGWLESKDNSFGMHPVISEVIRSIRQPSIDNHIELIKACTKTLEEDYNKLFKDKTPVWIFADAILINLLYNESPEIADLLVALGEINVHLGAYYNALIQFQNAREIRINIHPNDEEKLSYIYHDIGYIFWNLDEYHLATEWYNKALLIREDIYGIEHPDTATTYDNLSLVYLNLDDFPNAFKYCNLAFDIRKKVLDPFHKNLAISYSNKAELYFASDDFDKALVNYKQALIIRNKIFGLEHIETISTLINISLISIHQGSIVKELLKIYDLLIPLTEILGTKHPYLINLYRSMGLMYIKANHVDNRNIALHFFEEALSIHKVSYYSDNLMSAYLYSDIAQHILLPVDKSNAFNKFKVAYGIFYNILGSDHSTTKGCENILQKIYYGFGHNKNKKQFKKILNKEISKFKKRYITEE